MTNEASTMVVVARAALEGGAACSPTSLAAPYTRGCARQRGGPAAPGHRPGLRDGARGRA